VRDTAGPPLTFVHDEPGSRDRAMPPNVHERARTTDGAALTNLENGMLVQHTSLGLGKVVALEPNAVHVFFAESDARVATKLRLPTTLSFLTPAAASNAWLSGVSGFALDAKTGRYRLPGAWLSHADAVARFDEAFPQRFADPAYLGATGKHDRVLRWRRAHDAYAEELAEGRGERLLDAGDVAELSARALKVERHVRPLLGDAKASLTQALANPEDAHRYFAALFELLATRDPDRERFDALAAEVSRISPGESGWPVATLLPFVAAPDLHMLLRPRFACAVAQRLGVELSYEPAPCWATYSSLLRSTRSLLEKLRSIGARDHVDVESFMHAVTTTKAGRAAPRSRGG
jgi:hypothetical protein